MSEAYTQIPEQLPENNNSLSIPDVQEKLASFDVVENPDQKTLLDKIKTTFAIGVVACEVLPFNEAIRGSIYASAVLASGNSLVVSSVAAGASTLIVEGAAAIAAANLLTTNTSQQVYDWTNHKLRKIGINDSDKVSTATKIGTASLGGSVVTMALERRDRPDITKKELRKYGLKVSAGLGAALAVAGAAASEGIDLIKDKPIYGAGIAMSVGAVALGRSINKQRNIQRSTPEILKEWRLDTDKYGISYGLVADDIRLKKAAILEQEVWDEKGYGNLEEEGYTDYIKNSRTFSAFDVNGDCIGVNRMFQASGEELPPFLDMDFYDNNEKSEIAQTAMDGDTEELGTVAVLNAYRGKRVNLRLWRLAYRDSRSRGIKHWGIIMEPERVEKMNKYQGFTFRQLGPAVPYQGGDCAPFIMDLQEVDESMSKDHKLNYYWFVKKKLKR